MNIPDDLARDVALEIRVVRRMHAAAAVERWTLTHIWRGELDPSDVERVEADAAARFDDLHPVLAEFAALVDADHR